MGHPLKRGGFSRCTYNQPYAFRAAFCKWSAMRDASKKRKKNEISINQQKVFFFIGAFQYTSVSVGKGVRPLFIFFFRACFFRIFFEKKTENCSFCAFLGFWKKGGVSLVGIRKYWDLFFCWARLSSLNFKNFFAVSWFEAV